jgi:hypothetical protein
MTDTARRRIEVLREYSHLGAGFQVALYDLEIRGAGNIVGYEQSGQIAALGFELYAQMLRDTIRELQGEPVTEQPATQVTICRRSSGGLRRRDAARLGFYKRIAAHDPSAGPPRRLCEPSGLPIRHRTSSGWRGCAWRQARLERVDWRPARWSWPRNRGAAGAGVASSSPAGGRGWSAEPLVALARPARGAAR